MIQILIPVALHSQVQSVAATHVWIDMGRRRKMMTLRGDEKGKLKLEEEDGRIRRKGGLSCDRVGQERKRELRSRGLRKDMI